VSGLTVGRRITSGSKSDHDGQRGLEPDCLAPSEVNGRSTKQGTVIVSGAKDPTVETVRSFGTAALSMMVRRCSKVTGRNGPGSRKKHGVTFEEAATVFTDPLAVVRVNRSPSRDERRMQILGYSLLGRLLR
jgi:hypothetical protein